MSRGSAGSRRVDRARLRGALKRIVDLSWDENECSTIRAIAEAALGRARPAHDHEWDPDDICYTCDASKPAPPPTPEELAHAKAQRERIAGILAASRARVEATYPGYVPSNGITPSTYDRAAAADAPWYRKRQTLARVAAEKIAPWPFKRTTTIERAPIADEWCEDCGARPCRMAELARQGR